MSAFSKRLLLIASDTMLLQAGMLAGLLIRFEGRLPGAFLSTYAKVALPYTALSLLAFAAAGLYVSLWRYASVDEIWVVLRATTCSAAILAALLYALPRMMEWLLGTPLPGVGPFPRSVVILSWLLTTLLVGGLRLSFRVAARAARPGRDRVPADGHPDGRRRILVVGAGEAGAMVAGELTRHLELGCTIVGFIDDDPSKQGMKVRHLPVLGTRAELGQVVRRQAVDEVIIAMPSAPGRVIREVVDGLKDQQVRIKTLPGLYELLDANVSLNQIREVQIEDLLGRQPVALAVDEIAGYLRGQVVLVTGAGGSIGSELCRQVARFQPRELLILDNSENGAFETEQDLGYRFPNLRCRLLVADVRDREKVRAILATFRPQVIFHAAAHKHVPLMEAHPDEAVKTNVFGTLNVAEAALECGASRFVLISTDKAVHPSSIMGCTKRVAEMIIQALDAERRRRELAVTCFAAVRFGNVLGSRGSVLPTFQSQIARGGPVTVTHPEMRRYFMTVPEASQLVMQAAAMGEGGEIFVLDMGEPVRILDLAQNLIRLSGLRGEEVPIVFTRPRPGEKLFEELLTAEEGAQATRHQRIFISPGQPIRLETLQPALAELASLARHPSSAGQLRERLHHLAGAGSGSGHLEAAAGRDPGTEPPLRSV